MADKITTVPKIRIGARVGRLDDAGLHRLNQAALAHLGLTVSVRARGKA